MPPESGSVHPPRVLVIRRRYLGDIVLLGSFLANLRAYWPRAEISVLVEEAYAEILQLQPEANRVFILERSGGLAGWWKLARALRSARFSHVFDLDNGERTALLARVTGAPFRAALLHEGIKPRFVSLYTSTVTDPGYLHENRHITEYYLSLLETAHIPVVTREVSLRLRDADRIFAHELLTSLGISYAQPRLLVHPGSRSPYRLWPAERFAEVIERTHRELNARTILLGGPGDRSTIDEIRRRVTTPVAVVDRVLPVAQFAALASACEVLLCHDSGPMHVAAAVGARVVALLGSQNPIVFAPLGKGHTVLQAPLPCRDCVAPSACHPVDSYRNYCVQRLSVEQVWGAVRETLSH